VKFPLESKFWITLLSASTFFIGSAIGANVSVSKSQEISGCVNKKTGDLRISDECLRNERKIQWNVQGIQGAQGLAGEKGEAGERGLQGKPGTSVMSGSGVPNAFAGEEGDFYIDLTTYKIYGPKKNDYWGVERDLVGPQGLTGAMGPAGATGVPGPAGPAGNSGLSAAYFDSTDLGFEHSGAGSELCHTSDFVLPSGRYIVMAYVEAEYDSRRDIGGQIQMAPRVGIGADISEPLLGTTVPEFGMGSVSILWTFKSVAANSHIDLYCDSSGGIEFRTYSVVAIAADSITDLP
jgi:hypothetical protein